MPDFRERVYELRRGRKEALRRFGVSSDDDSSSAVQNPAPAEP
jgi:hypothetical protein